MTKLSITGADNKTAIPFLKNLVDSNPEIELGILYFLEKEGIQRNPDYSKRAMFFQELPKDRLSLHLCGETIFRIILQDNYQENLYYKEFSKVNRIQININARKPIFTKDEILKIYQTLLNDGHNLILQYHEKSKEWILPFLEQNLNKSNAGQINILLDSSLGRGVLADKFEIPQELKKYFFLNFGFSGGLNVENIANIHQQVKKLGVKYWLDLETGARTNNELDESKVIALEKEVFNN